MNPLLIKYAFIAQQDVEAGAKTLGEIGLCVKQSSFDDQIR